MINFSVGTFVGVLGFWLRKMVFAYICSQLLHPGWMESACFTSVTQMLLHQLYNSLYLTLVFYHSLIGKICICWLKFETCAKWVGVQIPYVVFFPFLKHFTRGCTLSWLGLGCALQSAGCCWNGCVQHRPAPGPGPQLLPMQTSPHLPPNPDRRAWHKWVKCSVLGTHTQAKHDKSTSGTKSKFTWIPVCLSHMGYVFLCF